MVLEPGTAAKRRARLRGAVCVALVVATTATFSGVFSNGFIQIDDPEYVTDNPAVLGGLTPDIVLWAFTRVHAGNWHPLTWLSHALDVELFGLEPAGHHATSLALHALNAVLVFLLLDGLTGALGRSAFVAFVFALHPLHVESVAWVAERKDVLSTAFGLASLVAWLGFVRDGSQRAYALSWAAFACALLSKPMLVTLPFLMLLLDLWPLERFRAPLAASVRARLVEKLPFFALSLASATVTLLAQSSSVSSLSLAMRFSNACIAYARYMFHALWPIELSPFYRYVYDWEFGTVAIAFVFHLAVGGFALARFRRQPYWLIGWLWFGGLLVPTIGLVQVGQQAMADRYMYLPLVGIALAVAWGAYGALRRVPGRGAILAVGAVGALLALAAATRAQVALWHDQVTLYEHALRVDPDNYFAHTAVGGIQVRDGNLKDGLAHLERAAELAPWHLWTRATLGHARLENGEPEAALEHLEWVYARYPGYDRLDVQLGRALEAVGRREEAVASYRRAWAREHAPLDAARRLAVLLALSPPPLGDPREALRVAERLVEESDAPADLDVYAAALAANGDFEQADRVAAQAEVRAIAAGDRRLARSIAHRRSRYQANERLQLDPSGSAVDPAARQ